MKVINKLLDYSTPWKFPDIYLFTGNPILKNNGAIVMGRGAAKQIRDTYPGIDKSFGLLICKSKHKLSLWHKNTYLLWYEITYQQHLGWFKVKDHWAEQAKISIINHSVVALTQMAKIYTDKVFHMNYPGIGNGHLKLSDVEPILIQLPDNVLLYKYTAPLRRR